MSVFQLAVIEHCMDLILWVDVGAPSEFSPHENEKFPQLLCVNGRQMRDISLRKQKGNEFFVRRYMAAVRKELERVDKEMSDRNGMHTSGTYGNIKVHDICLEDSLVIPEQREKITALRTTESKLICQMMGWNIQHESENQSPGASNDSEIIEDKS